MSIQVHASKTLVHSLVFEQHKGYLRVEKSVSTPVPVKPLWPNALPAMIYWPPEFTCVLSGPQSFVYTDSRLWPLGSRVTEAGVPGPEVKGCYRGTKSLDLKIPNRLL